MKSVRPSIRPCFHPLPSSLSIPGQLPKSDLSDNICTIISEQVLVLAFEFGLSLALFILFFSNRTGLGISAQALLVNLSSSGCWYEAAVESTMCVTIRGRELPSIIEFMRLDSTLTGPGFTWCISSCDVVYRTLVLLSCCNIAVLSYTVTVLHCDNGTVRAGKASVTDFTASFPSPRGVQHCPPCQTHNTFPP